MSYTVGIIPARMGSSRFPGKPLADICGIAMIEHVYRRSAMAKSLDDVYIATCDAEIEDYCKCHGMGVIMTSPLHERASDRAAEAMEKIESAGKRTVDVVAMIQGDEPLVYPDMIDLAIDALAADSAAEVVNLMASIATREEHEDPNEVKVVVDLNDYALYFSREPIPSRKKGAAQLPMFKQVCIIPFTRSALLKFNALPQTPLEIVESVDMMRLLEHGLKVRMVRIDRVVYSVDTQQDLMKVRGIMESDPLWMRYREQ